MSAMMSSDSQQIFSQPAVDLDTGATYFQPCSDVSRQYVANDVWGRFY
jgi:hypothetical protein